MEPLTPYEQDLLRDILNQHLEGMDDAREHMITDPVTFKSFESFTETLQQHDLDKLVVESIKRKVLDDNEQGSGGDSSGEP